MKIQEIRNNSLHSVILKNTEVLDYFSTWTVKKLYWYEVNCNLIFRNMQ